MSAPEMAPEVAPPVVVWWFECRVDSLCGCGCEIETSDLSAWLPGGNDGDGRIVCLDCGEAAEGWAVA